MRTFAGAAMAVAVVALFALLLHSFALGRTSTGPGASGPTPTASATTAPNTWHSDKNLTYTTTQQGDNALPAFAPNDPSTVYVATLDLPNPPTLRRTTNAGATWTTLPLPGDTSNVEQVQVFVSPLSAKTVFVAITTPLPPTSDPSSCPNIALRPRHGGILASGTIPCTFEYLSTDSGAHWQRLQFPAPGVLVGVQPLFSWSQGHVLRAQGNTLFALLGCTLCSGSPTDLVASHDGGATWSLVDSQILDGQGSVCDFMPAPTGGEVYAISYVDNCAPLGLPDLEVSLWHSGDSGKHWARVGALPPKAAFGIAVVPQATGPALVYIHMPPATQQGRGTSVQDGPTSLQVSTDGGHTWHKAPSAGIPSTTPYPNPGLPLGVLSDGTVIQGFAGSGSDTSAPLATLYGWKVGQSSWVRIAPQLDAWLLSLTVAPGPGASGDTLWAVVNDNNSSQPYNIHIESYKLR
jgi:hypothetical protein